jgi:serine/threonine protein kinase
VAGESIKSKADPGADTMTSTLPAQPVHGSAPEASGTLEKSSGLVLGAHSSERLVSNGDAEGLGRCLARPEVVAYLGPACPKDLRVRVETHTVACDACRRWVRHVDDEILEYVGGQRSEEELARMDAHLDACGTCRGLVHHVLQGMAQSWHGEERDGPESGTTFVAGSVVNSRYLIRKFVGRGGMGEVYEAFDRLMDRRIALKTMLHTVADRPRASRRFKEEVRNAQRVGHPHVCRINDLQEHREGVFGPALPFFTMEFIDGERLGNLLQESTLPLDDARVVALQLLGGLSAAHQRGVLHLDFKSDNVMLRHNTQKPDAVIMDFGLSRILGNESRLRTTDRRQFAGTLPYMSVEQLECREDLGPATDVYAFGVVLYEVLTRALPFTGESLGAVLLKQLNERPKPPSHHVPSLAPALDRFVLKCLSLNPRARYANAGDALQALQSLGPWTRPQGVGSRFWKKAVPGAAVAVVVGLVATSAVRRSSPAKPIRPGVESPSQSPGEQRVEQLTRELAPVTVPQEASAASRPAEPETPVPSPVAPVSTAPARALPAARREQHGPSGARTPRTSSEPAAFQRPEGAPPSAKNEPPQTQPVQTGAPLAPPRPEGQPRAEHESAGRRPTAPGAPDDGSWKPSRVPRRLSAPVPPAAASGPGAPRVKTGVDTAARETLHR